MPSAHRRRPIAVSLAPLEGRSLVSTLTGNSGQIFGSQFQPYGYAHFGQQVWDVTTARGQSIRMRAPFNHGDPPPTPSGWVIPTAPTNTGTIADSQFAAAGFSTIGFQLRNVAIAGAFSLDDYDESLGQDADGGSPPVPSIGPHATPQPVPPGLLDIPINSGAIVSSQFADGGFGNIGLQWSDINLGGDLNITTHTSIRYPDASARLQHSSAPSLATSAASETAAVNTGLIHSSQFADGGFGNLGLQWSGVKVGGPVDLGAERWIVQPQGGPTPTSGPNISPTRASSSSATNTGRIQSSQFADGGFGQIGFQWSQVAVAGRVATGNNALIVQPERDLVGPISTAALVFGNLPAPSESDPNGVIASASSGSPPAAAVEAVAPIASDSTNGATNSGTLASSQFADGGFGDIGMQWREVSIGGSVLATHNQLSIQPENRGQGMIIVSDVSFPATPPARSPLPSQPGTIPTHDPSLIVEDGKPVTAPLPDPTGPGDRSFAVNQATNSGNITGSQLADGGFGDIGMQWRGVSVSGDVVLVHNAVSVQLEGSDLAGVQVSNISFGTPSALATAASLPARHTLLKRLVAPSRTAPRQSNITPQPPSAHNRLDQVNRQLLSARAQDVTFQWTSATVSGSGLTIVHNVLTVENNGPRSAPVVLRNIRFPGRVPPPNVTPNPGANRPSPRVATLASRTLDRATNSGTITSGQFLDGGTGDVGVQWRNVTLGGSVTVIHNSLSVDVNADAASTGPITVSGIAFNSGLPADLTDGTIVSPPRYSSRRNAGGGSLSPSHPTPGVIERATNSGSLTGGQFLSGGMGQVGLQWLDTSYSGPVTIVNNVLSVQVSGTATGRVIVRDVTFS